MTETTGKIGSKGELYTPVKIRTELGFLTSQQHRYIFPEVYIQSRKILATFESLAKRFVPRTPAMFYNKIH